jgi:hypothetical protein
MKPCPLISFLSAALLHGLTLFSLPHLHNRSMHKTSKLLMPRRQWPSLLRAGRPISRSCLVVKEKPTTPPGRTTTWSIARYDGRQYSAMALAGTPVCFEKLFDPPSPSPPTCRNALRRRSRRSGTGSMKCTKRSAGKTRNATNATFPAGGSLLRGGKGKVQHHPLVGVDVGVSAICLPGWPR